MKLKTAILSPILIIISIVCITSVRSDSEYLLKRVVTDFSPGDGKLAIYNYHLNEVLETRYRDGNTYDRDGLNKIQHIFRSRSDNKEHPIDLELIELLDHIQDRFGADAIELISGYRSPELNRQLREEGTNVAEKSAHMNGLAADIHIDEVTEEMLSEYARSLKAGGVGYYPANDFVHIDTSEVRRWDLPDNPGRPLIGFRKNAEWQVITNKDIYLPGETINYEIMNITRSPQTLKGRPVLEVFNRGKWSKVAKLKLADSAPIAAGGIVGGAWRPSEKDRFGKYRIVIPGPEGFSHLSALSNEFYRKKY